MFSGLFEGWEGGNEPSLFAQCDPQYPVVILAQATLRFSAFCFCVVTKISFSRPPGENSSGWHFPPFHSFSTCTAVKFGVKDFVKFRSSSPELRYSGVHRQFPTKNQTKQIVSFAHSAGMAEVDFITAFELKL